VVVDINWNLNALHKRYKGKGEKQLPELRFAGGLRGLLLGLDIHNEFLDKLRETYGETLGQVKETGRRLGGLDYETVRSLPASLNFDLVNYAIPPGTLLAQLAADGEQPEAVRDRILKRLKKKRGADALNWNLATLREELGKEIDYLKSPTFPYGKILWGLNLHKEFVAEFEVRFRDPAYRESRHAIGISFGWQDNPNTVLEVTLRNIRELQAAYDAAQREAQAAQTEGVRTRGARRQADTDQDQELTGVDIFKPLRRDGMSDAAAVVGKLKSPEFNWRLPEFFETYLKDDYPWFLRNYGYYGLVERLGIQEAYVQAVQDRYVAYSGLQGVAWESLGFKDRTVFKKMETELEINFSDLIIPDGNLLTTLNIPDKGFVLAMLEDSNWNLPELRQKMAERDPI